MRFYFDFSVNGSLAQDLMGTEFESVGDARAEAMRALLDIAKDELGAASSQSFLVTVREADVPVYKAALTFDGNVTPC